MVSKVQIWHNSRCSKSRDAFQWLADKGIDNEWVDYMKNPINKEDLALVLAKLKMPAYDLIRKGEKIFKENWKDVTKSDGEWIEIMVEHPNLIERPIIINGKKAVIARPLEKIEELF